MEDILRVIFEFSGSDKYIYISPVCKLWMRAYGSKSQITNINIKEATKKEFIYALENGLDENRHVISKCVQFDRLDLLKLCSQYFTRETFSDLCYLCAQSGNFRILEWAKMMNYDWGAYTCDTLYLGGKYSILKWAIINGEHWNGSCRFWNYLNPKTLSQDDLESMHWLTEKSYIYQNEFV